MTATVRFWLAYRSYRRYERITRRMAWHKTWHEPMPGWMDSR